MLLLRVIRLTPIFGWIALAWTSSAGDLDPFWKTNVPIVSVQQELYLKHSAPRTAALVGMQLVGGKLERREWRATEKVSDVTESHTSRWSLDNGKSWGPWVTQEASSLVDYSGTKVTETGWAETYDPESGQLVQLWLRQIEIKGGFHNATYWRTSKDLGRTWSHPVTFRYELGPEFDPKNPLLPNFLEKNNGYPGSGIMVRKDGGLLVCLAHANAIKDPKKNQRPWRLGSVLFIGRWNQVQQRYVWIPGARTEISPELSGRGLMEPDAAELQDGRVCVIWRGSDRDDAGGFAKEPGRKWVAVSSDGGQSLSAPRPLGYDDGTLFYSPSSFHRLIRHRGTGKLLWIGNISPTVPEGNSPRYPLILAEVDETKVALKRNSVTVIADREPHHGPAIQFSNFSLLEDPESHDLEIYLTTYGQESNPEDWATADSLKYRLTFLKSNHP